MCSEVCTTDYASCGVLLQCALKTLMVFHRLMRESEGASFVAELGKYGGHGYGGRGGALNMDSFIDNTSGDGKCVSCITTLSACSLGTETPVDIRFKRLPDEWWMMDCIICIHSRLSSICSGSCASS